MILTNSINKLKILSTLSNFRYQIKFYDKLNSHKEYHMNIKDSFIDHIG